MEKFDPKKITLKEYMDASNKFCDAMENCASCLFDGGPMQCKKDAVDPSTAKEVFEKLEEIKQNKSPYELVRQDLFNMCTNRKVSLGGCNGCKLRLGDKYCLTWFFEEMLSEIEGWKNEQNAGN